MNSHEFTRVLPRLRHQPGRWKAYAAAVALLAGLGVPVAAGTASAAPSALPGPVTYSQGTVDDCSGNVYTVPPDITLVQVTAVGAAGASGGGPGHAGKGGRGAKVTADVTVTPGESLYVQVASSASFGFGGGGSNAGGAGGNGGDPSYVSTDPTALTANPYTQYTDLQGLGCQVNSFVVIAGGGGGGGGAIGGNGGNGGDAGFTTGGEGANGGSYLSGSGGGGTQTAGGSGGQNTNSQVGQFPGGISGGFLVAGSGGEAGVTITDENIEGGGGGGGGYYGGGGGGAGDGSGASGGGGGSSFVTAGATHISHSTSTDAPSVTIAPITQAPTAPTGVSAVAGDQQATISWTAPQYDGGAPIEYYTVTEYPDGLTTTTTSTSAVFTNLTAGSQFKFKVTATNEAGTGPASLASSTVTPYRLPGAPVIQSVTAGKAQAKVTFTASAADTQLGNPITSYTVTARPGVNVTTGPGITQTGTKSPITVTGLTDGGNYTVTVYATNGAGNGPESAPQVVTPQTVPAAPANLVATDVTPPGATTGSADISFTPPDNGGRPILSYTVTSSPGGITATAGGRASDIQITGLTLGTSYTFTVYATNAVGNGPASAPSNALSTAPVPSPPQNPGAATLNQAAYVSCLPPADDGGSAITSYTVTSSPGGITATGPSCPILVTGLTDGTKYSFTVTATNAAGGTSQPSQPTTKITPHVPSGKPPANDDFANAQVVSGASGSVTGTNVGATLEAGEPTIQDAKGGASVWYKWTVPVTGSYQFDTCSANPDLPANIGLFTGSTVSTSTEFGPGPSQDLCPAGEGGATIVTSTMSAGLTLYIKADGLNENFVNGNPPYEGVFTLEWSQKS